MRHKLPTFEATQPKLRLDLDALDRLVLEHFDLQQVLSPDLGTTLTCRAQVKSLRGDRCPYHSDLAK